MNRFSLQHQLSNIYSQLHTESQRPVIGITANYGEQTAKLAEGYYKQVEQAGGTPIIIPSLDKPKVLEETLNHIDALLLSGGADLNPLYQGEEPSPLLGGINAERDLPELLITRMAFNRQMPILGICRGIQTLAVALGGKVAQDISELKFGQEGPSEGYLGQDGPDNGNARSAVQRIKHSQDAARHLPTHTITIKDHSTLYNLYKDSISLVTESDEQHHGVLPVNSFHHQAVADPGPHLCISATAPDGVIEAVESSEHKPVMGLQWHPECMGDDGRPPFSWLVGEALKYRRVQQVHDRVLTLDTHCDTPMFFPQGIEFGTRDSRICVDLPKMIEGRLDATIMVAYIPQYNIPALPSSSVTPVPPVTPKAYADAIFDRITHIVNQHSDQIALAHTPEDLWTNKKEGKKSIMLGIENGRALEGKLSNVRHFAQRGIVYITLCHNGDNELCDSAKGNQTHGGVSDFGAKVIRKMNELGLMVDLSHASEKSFYDALELSKTPIVCSHSSCRALCDHPRNLTDEQLKALAAKGGVCQITLYPGFLRAQGAEASILDAIAHLEHAISVAGIDHVGLGTDFDGDGGVPGLADASELTLFTRQLLQRCYSEEDIQKIWGGNFLRVMKQVQNVKTI